MKIFDVRNYLDDAILCLDDSVSSSCNGCYWNLGGVCHLNYSDIEKMYRILVRDINDDVVLYPYFLLLKQLQIKEGLKGGS